MIEVEKKFQPTEEQLERLLEGATFVKEKIMHDVYYDFPDFRIYKSGKRLRKRDKGFELKETVMTESGIPVANEYATDVSIFENLQITEKESSLEDYVRHNMEILCEYTTLRKEYLKEDFTLDVDQMDFGINLVEVELIVENSNQITEAQKKIENLAQSIGLEIKDFPLKPDMYLEKLRPEVYNEIHKNQNEELKFRMK